ncbi:Aldehyde dehydrogenase family protein, partial [Oscillibacter sp. PC13]|uniref:aldehyde dehydrogenase family protein n=1 Tax=Oscillibacter sp. PC13 TaxID=1855299 RepID=UPI0008EFFF5F
MKVEEYVERARKAVEAIKGYNQEQVDKLVYEAAKIIYKNAEPLAREAVDETGLGYYEDKIAKNTDTPTAFWNYLKDKKSVGIIGEDKETGIIEVAHPVGVIACVTPATNPNVTPLGNFMDAMKGKNAIIVSPAPRAAQ